MALATGAGAAEWPQWQGAQRDNRSPDTGLLKTWPAGGPPLLWQRAGLGARGFSSVSVAGGLIYTSGAKADSPQSLVTALDMNGGIKWQSANGSEFLKSHGGTRATPTIDGGLVFVLNGTGRLGCFDAATGAEKWAVDLVASYGGVIPTWGYSESVVTDTDRVYVTAGGTKAGMVAFDKRTGALVWQTEPTLAASYCPPLLLDYGGVRQIITGTGVEFVGVRVSDGKILWRFPSTNQHKVHATTPVFQDGGLFLTSGYGYGSVLLDLKVEGETVTATKRWEYKPLDNQHGGVVLLDGCVYGHGDRGGWTCLDFKSGQVKWSDKTIGKGSLTYADGMLYCFAERDGTLSLVRATPEKFDLVCSFKVPKGGVKEFWAHPVVLDGRLYVRHSDVLYCYDVKAK
jgi:outer membrane protein assembly factor BamB